MAKLRIHIVLGLVGLFGGSVAAATARYWSPLSGPAALQFGEAALAPAVGGMTHSFDRIKADLVHRYETEQTLPRLTGAGDTSIHNAIRDVERLLEERKTLEALLLADELLDDLLRAQNSRRIGVLMEKWNERYPSDLPTDMIGEAHLTEWLAYLERLWSGANPADPDGSNFLRQMRRRFGLEFNAAMRESGYSSGLEMVIDYMDALNVETPFEVHVPKVFQELLGEPSPVALVVTGLPMVISIVSGLESQYAPLRDVEWVLKIDGGDFKSGYQFVLPNQKLELVIRGAS